MVGDAGSSATDKAGAVSATTTGCDLATVVCVASLTVTRNAIVSPRSPFPAMERSRVGAVAPAISEPFLVH